MGSKLQRFERHIDIPEVGLEGQKKLLSGSVLIIGMGGLGCPAALYLAAGGVGRIGFMDDDTVSLSNLQRQVLYDDHDVGVSKVTAAKRKLAAHAPDCVLEEQDARLSPENAAAVITRYDLVLDCSDNFNTRYLVNEFCVRLKKPLVSASVYHHEGQISTFRGWEADKPCYQCLYPKSEKLALAPQCTEDGILGPVTGIFGSMQAAVAMNELMGIGESLAGWMMMFSALTYDSQKVRLKKRASCETCCAMKAPIEDYVNNGANCGTN
ncbi:MAG: molybdopterin-synthase adenylyltransferase MoeB [Alphaproteobacteria bacterium]|jgi:adenylyltransferase/sulfurtransferase|nr:molybdopterin-synthase adenylyltransferase MoeB [Alphaproteobacteria bacterium]